MWVLPSPHSTAKPVVLADAYRASTPETDVAKDVTLKASNISWIVFSLFGFGLFGASEINTEHKDGSSYNSLVNACYQIYSMSTIDII